MDTPIDLSDIQLFASLFTGAYELAVDREEALQLIANHRTVDYRLIDIEAVIADRDAWKAKAEQYLFSLGVCTAVLHDMRDDWRCVAGTESIQYIRTANAYNQAMAALQEDTP